MPAVARRPAGSVSAVRSGAEICDVSPQGVDARQTQSHVIARQAEPAGVSQVVMTLSSETSNIAMNSAQWSLSPVCQKARRFLKR